MVPQKLRIYADSSVYGGAFEPGFQEHSLRFFEQVRQGRFALVTSAVVTRELGPAPPAVRRLGQEMLLHSEVLDIVPEAISLAGAYLLAGIVGQKSADDALHVALATVSGCYAIVSWNFRHIVQLHRIARYNAINVGARVWPY